MTSNFENFEQYVISDKIFSNIKTENIFSDNINTTNYTRSLSPCEHNLPMNNITKKTNRGRKEKITLPKNEPKCSICLQYKAISKDDLISCSICKCLFHKTCNPQYEIIPTLSNKNSLYRCIRCSQALKLNKPITDFKCFICNHSDSCLNYSTQSRQFYHQVCSFFINEFSDIYQEEINREIMKKWRYKNSCKYCGEKLSKSVAVIKCSKPQCKEYYHIPCTIDKGMIFDLNFMKKYYNVSTSNQIPFFCSNHNKKISHEYKTYIMDKFNESESDNNIKEDKKTFQNDSDFEEEKEEAQNEDNDMESKENEENKELNDLFKSIVSMSIAEDENKENEEDKKEEEKEEDEFKKENNGRSDGMDIDEDNENNNIFNLDFRTIAKNVEEEKKFEYNYDINSTNNNYKSGFNVDEFCSTKNKNLIINRENSCNLSTYNL